MEVIFDGVIFFLERLCCGYKPLKQISTSELPAVEHLPENGTKKEIV